MPNETGTTVVAEPAVQLREVIYMRCTENRVEDDYDGGLVLLQAIQGQETSRLIDGRVVMSHRHDETMREYPVTRDEKQGRYFRVVIEEIPFSEVPPDPNAPKPPQPASPFELLEAARQAALASGNQALAEQIGAQLRAGVAVPPVASAPEETP